MSSIAKISLAPGQIGYFDEVSRIRLTTTSPTAEIMMGTNVSKIKEDIKAGKLILVYGSLSTVVHRQGIARRGATRATNFSTPSVSVESVIAEEIIVPELTKVEPEESELSSEEIVKPTVEEVQEPEESEAVEVTSKKRKRK